jgi:hypothetical protein
MNEIYVLWQLVPETTMLYHLVQLSEDDFEKIKSCHGHYVNSSVDVPDTIRNNLLWLNEYLTNKDSSMVYSDTSNNLSPVEIKDCVLVICGWVL